MLSDYATFSMISKTAFRPSIVLKGRSSSILVIMLVLNIPVFICRYALGASYTAKYMYLDMFKKQAGL